MCLAMTSMRDQALLNKKTSLPILNPLPNWFGCLYDYCPEQPILLDWAVIQVVDFNHLDIFLLLHSGTHFVPSWLWNSGWCHHHHAGILIHFESIWIYVIYCPISTIFFYFILNTKLFFRRHLACQCGLLPNTVKLERWVLKELFSQLAFFKFMFMSNYLHCRQCRWCLAFDLQMA